ncbi:small membrane protein YdgU [Buttiauxella massiliensis]
MFTSGVWMMLRRYSFEIILTLLILCGIITLSFWL